MSNTNYPVIILGANVGCGCNTCGKSIILQSTHGGCGCQTVQMPVLTPSSNSPCTECETPCDDSFPTDCGAYSGGDIPQLGIKTGDKLTSIIIKLAAEVISLKQRVAVLEA